MRARETAVLTLIQIEREKSFAGLALKNALQSLTDPREKALATELIYGGVRYKKRLDYIRDCFSKIKSSKMDIAVIQIVRITLYQILYLDKIPHSAACNEGVRLAEKLVNKGAAQFVNGLIRAIIRQKNSLPVPHDFMEALRTELSFPKSIMDIWIADYGLEAATEIARCSNMQKGVSYRVNRLKAPHKFVLPPNLNGPQQENLFAQGFVTVQDKGSMFAVEALAPTAGDSVLDLCAAPGGKSCYMAEKMDNKGKITACDIYEHRLRLIEETANRLGVTIIETSINDGSVYNPLWEAAFDKVLADVPCSGLGVISGKPDIKWRKQNYESLCAVQYGILKNAARYVKKGGVVVYSTCTVHKRENEEIIQKVLAEQSGLVLAGSPVQLFPNAEHDGFFVCKMKKV